MGITTGVSEDELKQQANRQNPPSTDADFFGQPKFDSDFFNTDMPSVINTTGPTTTGSGAFDSVGIGAQFGVKPGTNGTPPVQVGGFPGTTDGQQEEKKTDYFDKLMHVTILGGKVLLDFLKQLITSMKNRNIEDWAVLSNTWFKTGGIMAGVGLVLVIIGIIGNLAPLKLGGFGGGLFLSGLLVDVFGIGGLGISLYLKTQGGEYSETGGEFEQLSAFEGMQGAVMESSGGFDSYTFDDEDEDKGFEYEDGDEEDDYDDNSFASQSYDDIMAKLGQSYDDNNLFGGDDEEIVEETIVHNVNDLVDGVKMNAPLITRKFLWDTFKPFFPRLTMDFEKSTALDLSSSDVLAIGAKINKAIKRMVASKAQEADIECVITEVMDTKFVYTVKFNRPEVRLDTQKFETELATFFKDSAEDENYRVQLSVFGDDYHLVIPKGNRDIVTLGDAFSSKEVEDFYTNDKNTIPIVVGVTERGKILYKNAFSIASMAIVGTPRGGKSSYVNALLFSMVTMCTPDDVAFVVIDPKRSMLFRTFSYMPHVVGLHRLEDTVAVLRCVLDGEGERRKKLLDDNRVENIKELRLKGIKIPMLYVVIDEVVTVILESQADGSDKEVKRLINMILTQLPSTGIGLILIPHRTTGILDPITRQNIAFKSVVRAGAESVKEELVIPKWTVPLPNPGDLAIISSGETNGQFARSVVPVDPRNSETADKDSRDLMVAIARAWYKMGVELPDLSSLGSACNRDEDKIKEELEISVNPNKIQYDLDLGSYRD